MNLTRLALRNSQFVLIVILIAVLLGVRSFISMPRSEDPQVAFPIYFATIVYPGTSPEDMEKLIVDPIEEAVNEIDNITEIKTGIREGLALISIEASFEIDAKDKYDEVLREINTVRPTLPDGIVLFDIQQIKPEDRVNFLLFAMTSDQVSYRELDGFAEDFKEVLEQVDGVNSVDVEASPKQEVRIALDYQRMAAQNISLVQVVGALRSNNANIPGGNVQAGAKSFTIKSTGDFDNLDEIRNTIIAAADNRIVYLKDVANVRIDHEDIRWKAEYKQQKAVFISLKLKTGTNILDVDKAVMNVRDEFAKSLPPNIQLNTAFEQTSAVETRINDFFINLLQGVALVGLVILLVLGWRSAIIITTLIPLCIIIALALLNGAGYGLQQISIASLVLALGLLVDNGIVVIENINRFIKEGFSKKEAAQKGASEVGLAIASSTVTTLLSFFPLTQLGEGPGLFLASLPLTVIFALIISLILALTFSPLLSNWILSSKVSKPSYSDRFFNWFVDKVYEPILNFSLKRGWLIIIAAVGIFVFSISLFPKIGVSFFPTADKALLLIEVNTPKGSSIAATDKAVNYVESILDTMDYVKDFTSNVGHGNPQIYYNRIPKSFEQRHGQILVNFTEWDPGRFYQTIAQLRKTFADYPGAKVTMEELKNGVPVEAPIEIRVFGDDLKEIKQLANQVESIMESHPQVINIVNPLRRNQTQLKIKLNKEKAGLLGVSELDFDQTIRASLNGLVIDQVSLDDGEDYNLVLRMPFDEQPDIEDLNKIYVANRQGRLIPLNHIADIEFEGGIPEFSHFDLNRNIKLKASLNNLDNTIPVTIEMIDSLDSMDWPKGYHYEVGGEYAEQQSTFGSLGIILVLAQVAIFAVLVLQFRSILQPLIVFSAIPLAVSGSFIMLYLTGWSFSFFAFVGLISLIGIVVNNSIIMVDVMNQLIREGSSLREAIIQGSKRRLKPIVLTTITTILGLLPLTLQGTNLWSPLSLTIIGGMISSTVLSLIVVPVLYKWLTKGQIS
ncbi:MAG: multidrug efflux pump subunit AcrB [Saprospiraceae bacterium]|jgi:multidrug efflux pump subunit AcrB